MILRAILIINLLFSYCSTDVQAQYLMPVYWETLDGQLDSAYIRKQWKPIKNISDWPLYAEILELRREWRNDVFIADMKWLRHGNSLLLRRIEQEDGQAIYLQLLYEGAVSLYAVIGERSYYLKYEDEFYPLDKANPRSTFMELVLGHCAEQSRAGRVTNSEAILAFVRQVNDCLNAPGYRWVSGNFPHRFKVGLGYNWNTEDTRLAVPFFRGFATWTDYALQSPKMSVIVNYTPWSASPWFSTDLQIRAIHFNREKDIRLANYQGVRQEALEVTNLYFYPGIRLQGNNARTLQPYLGGGAAVVLPLHFRYQMKFADPSFTHPGFPVREELRAGQNPKLGFYTTCGVNLRFFNRILIGVGLRTEWLYQDWQHYEQVSRRSRYLLPFLYELAPYDWRFLQFQFAYAWK